MVEIVSLDEGLNEPETIEHVDAILVHVLSLHEFILNIEETFFALLSKVLQNLFFVLLFFLSGLQIDVTEGVSAASGHFFRLALNGYFPHRIEPLDLIVL